MKVEIDELRRVFIQALTSRGLTIDEARVVAGPFLEAELAGKRTHGISKFFLIDDAIKNRQGKPEIIKDKFNYALIDAHRELGYISAQFACDVLLKKVSEFGNAIVATKNSYYYSIAGIYARRVAEAGYVAIITNNGGPAAVTSFGGVEPILGTNPIAIGLPYKGGAIVLDMATSARAWGEINLAKIEGRTLEAGIFIDSAGIETVDPYAAVAIKSFGGAKGAGLNFMLEVLTGAFVGAKMGLQSKDGYDLGFLFMAYDPGMFTDKDVFDGQLEQLVFEIKNSKKHSSAGEIFLPGEQSHLRLAAVLREGEIEISDSTWEDLKSFSEGVDIKVKNRLIE